MPRILSAPVWRHSPLTSAYLAPCCQHPMWLQQSTWTQGLIAAGCVTSCASADGLHVAWQHGQHIGAFRCVLLPHASRCSHVVLMPQPGSALPWLCAPGSMSMPGSSCQHACTESETVAYLALQTGEMWWRHGAGVLLLQMPAMEQRNHLGLLVASWQHRCSNNIRGRCNNMREHHMELGFDMPWGSGGPGLLRMFSKARTRREMHARGAVEPGSCP